MMLSLSNWLSENKSSSLGCPTAALFTQSAGETLGCIYTHRLAHTHSHRGLGYARPLCRMKKASYWLHGTVSGSALNQRARFTSERFQSATWKTPRGLPGVLRPTEVSWTFLANRARRLSIWHAVQSALFCWAFFLVSPTLHHQSALIPGKNEQPFLFERLDKEDW